MGSASFGVPTAHGVDQGRAIGAECSRAVADSGVKVFYSREVRFAPHD